MKTSEPNPQNRPHWDVVIIGGALTGASTAIQLKKQQPDLRVLVVESHEKFHRRVGESTVEISSWFLMRVLGLTEYLNQNHIVKQGLRFWFTNSEAKCFDSCSEIGPKYNVNLPAFQVDRAELDEHVLAKASTLGVEIWRPAEVKSVALNTGGDQVMKILKDGETMELATRWVVDASGAKRMLARKNGWARTNERHPIASVWTRWKGVCAWDDEELCADHPGFAKRCFGSRQTATNHLIGKGWWSWWIALKGGDMSVGVVYDERLVALPEGGSPVERMRALLATHPLAERLLKNATNDPEDVHFRKNLPYTSDEMAGDGFALVGDAAAFLDPFYSPGMDWIAFSSASVSAMILRERAGEMSMEEPATLNTQMKLSYERWFEAIYQDKYFYMGDYELMRLAFMLDLGVYYFGVVSQPFKHGLKGLELPPFNGPGTTASFHLIRFYNRRLAKIAARRMRTGEWGRKNANHYHPFVSYRFNAALPWRLVATACRFAALELREGWKTWLPGKLELPASHPPLKEIIEAPAASR